MDSPVWIHFLSYSAWTLFQQFILQSFFYVSLEDLLGSTRKAVWATAGLFAVTHIPNPVLVPATLVAGLGFVKLFQRARNIYPLGIAHAILGLSIAISAPSGLIRNMRVGASYFRYQEVQERVRKAQKDQSVPQRWVESMRFLN